MIAVGALMLLLLARTLLSPIELTASTKEKDAQHRPADNVPPVSVEAMAALNLFGHKPAELAPDMATLPTTNLNLKIAGIIASTQLGTSRVLIAADGKPAQSFFVGDKLSPDVTLHSIERDFVVVQRGAQLEKLPLHVSASVANAMNGARNNTAFVAPTLLTTTPTANTAPTPQTVYRDLEDRLTQIRQKKPS